MGIQEKKQEETLIDELLQGEHQLILFNDDVNTFDYVIEMLVKICKHSEIQAEQCAMLVHYKGKCVVSSGELKKLIPMCSALLDAGLSAEIN